MKKGEQYKLPNYINDNPWASAALVLSVTRYSVNFALEPLLFTCFFSFFFNSFKTLYVKCENVVRPEMVRSLLMSK